MLKLFRTITIVLAALTALPLAALDNGAMAPMLNGLKYLSGKAFGLEPTKAERKKYPQKLYIVCFWGTWSPASRQALSILSYLKRSYGDSKGLDIVAISREDEPEIAKYLESRHDINFAVAYDKGSALTLLYLGSDYMNLPQIFIVDRYREVIWQGEAIDLEDQLKEIYAGTFDKNKESRIDKLQKSLRDYLQRRDYPSCLVLVDKILALEPGNAIALRTGLFIHENSKDYTKAFAFADKVIKMAPDKPRSYFVKLGLLQRTRQNVAAIKELAQQIVGKFSANREVMNDLAWMLMERFEFNASLVDLTAQAAQLAVKDIEQEKDIYRKALYLSTRARNYYVLGNNAKALETQQQAAKVLEGTSRESAALELCEYYRKLIEENNKK